ncbi:mitochondrial carrier domain-containing protein, partial [Catenaria anguillulae PL171]
PHLLNDVCCHARTISASTTAIIGNLLGYPFDSVKTRMQTFSYPTIGHCIRHTYATEGLRGFFRGILPQMATSSVFKTASFAAYVRAKSAIANAPSVQEATGQSAAGKLFVSSFGGGFCSGVFTAFLTQPLELIKVCGSCRRC